MMSSQSYMLTITADLVEQAGPSLGRYFARRISNNHDVQELITDLAGIGIAAVCQAFKAPPAASPAVNASSHYRPVYVYYLWNAYYGQWMIWNPYVNSWVWV